MGLKGPYYNWSASGRNTLDVIESCRQGTEQQKGTAQFFNPVIRKHRTVQPVGMKVKLPCLPFDANTYRLDQTQEVLYIDDSRDVLESHRYRTQKCCRDYG